MHKFCILFSVGVGLSGVIMGVVGYKLAKLLIAKIKSHPRIRFSRIPTEPPTGDEAEEFLMTTVEQPMQYPNYKADPNDGL